MRIAFLSNEKNQLARVYTNESVEKIKLLGEVSDFISGGELDAHREYLREVEVIFCTWGMPSFTKEQIAEYFPQLRLVLYGAGSVQHFARPFLESGIKVSSAFRANAVPVAEYTFAQILLASKHYNHNIRKYKRSRASTFIHHNICTGNYNAKIGIVGVGAIGAMVAERLKSVDVQVLGYDPFLSEDRAKELNVRLVDLATIFSECDVITNHLANKAELNNIFSYDLFRLMKDTATFINTGRGAQVNEKGLAKALRQCKHRSALIDVIQHEGTPILSPLYWRRNCYMTSHIAGSVGGEVVRMGDYMIAECERYLAGEPLSHEVTLAMLVNMA